jgi:hypothetical protein
MTITRAIKELTHQQLAAAEKVGREKHLLFPMTGRALWEAAQPVLQSPVTKRVWIVWGDMKNGKANAEWRIAGESALAHFTDLAASGVGHWAVTADSWATLVKRFDVQVLASAPSGNHQSANHGQPIRIGQEAMELELWAYQPDRITPGTPWVDRLSLWLSMTTNTDERIEMARESLLEQVWSTLPW